MKGKLISSDARSANIHGESTNRDFLRKNLVKTSRDILVQSTGVPKNKMDFSKFLKQKYIKIIVKTNSKKTEIAGIDSSRDALKVNIRAKPENNEANVEIVKFFSKLTGKKARIKTGLRSKEKLIELIG